MSGLIRNYSLDDFGCFVDKHCSNLVDSHNKQIEIMTGRKNTRLRESSQCVMQLYNVRRIIVNHFYGSYELVFNN